MRRAVLRRASNGATGVALAGLLGLPPRRRGASGSSFDAARPTATVERELEGGLVGGLRVALPALLTVQTGINEPRYAKLRAIKQAREKPLDVVSLEDSGWTPRPSAAARVAPVDAARTPERGEGAEMLEGSPADVAARSSRSSGERMAGMSGVLVVAETGAESCAT